MGHNLNSLRVAGVAEYAKDTIVKWNKMMTAKEEA
jgi:hypothetical protein